MAWSEPQSSWIITILVGQITYTYRPTLKLTHAVESVGLISNNDNNNISGGMYGEIAVLNSNASTWRLCIGFWQFINQSLPELDLLCLLLSWRSCRLLSVLWEAVEPFSMACLPVAFLDVYSERGLSDEVTVSKESSRESTLFAWCDVPDCLVWKQHYV